MNRDDYDPSDFHEDPVLLDEQRRGRREDHQIEEPDELVLLDEATAHNERMRELRAEAGDE
jgi:hypothetical protein